MESYCRLRCFRAKVEVFGAGLTARGYVYIYIYMHEIKLCVYIESYDIHLWLHASPTPKPKDLKPLKPKRTHLKISKPSSCPMLLNTMLESRGALSRRSSSTLPARGPAVDTLWKVPGSSTELERAGLVSVGGSGVWFRLLWFKGVGIT